MSRGNEIRTMVWSAVCLIGLIQVVAAGCSPNDQMCLEKEAMSMTNGYRGQSGMKPLGMPTIAQFNNAMKHSRDMMAAGYIYHQQLPMASEVGCGMWLTGENSPPHYANIMSNTPDTVAYGYALSSDGKVYCTQTFGTYVGSPGQGGSCAIFGGGSSTPASPRSTGTKKPKKPTKKVTRAKPRKARKQRRARAQRRNIKRRNMKKQRRQRAQRRRLQRKQRKHRK